MIRETIELWKKFFPIFHLPSSIFHLAVLLSLWPIFSGHITPTVDGPAHLYNSKLLVEVLVNQNGYLVDYFMLTPGLIPNWIGHFLLTLFLTFAPAFLAEKLLLVSYIFGFAYSWRYLVCSINKSNVYLSFFGLPFLFSFLFLMGFYNYCLSFIFAFLLLGLLLSLFRKNKVNPKQHVVLFVLPIVLYFSHVFVFGITMFVLASLLVFYAWHSVIVRKQGWSQVRQSTGALFFGMLLSTGFFALHFFHRPETISHKYLDVSTLFQWLWQARALLAYNWRIEGPFFVYFTPCILALLVLALATRWHRRKTKVDGSYITAKTKGGVIVFLCVFSVLFSLYFYLPDEDQLAGFVSVRLSMMILLAFILMLACFEVPKWAKVCSAAVVLYIHFSTVIYYSETLKELGIIADEVRSNAEFIQENSSVLVLDLCEDWKQAHYSNYLGIDKPLVILSNYEADMGYFPLKWNDPELPQLQLANRNQNDFDEVVWRENTSNPSKNIDYVFVHGQDRSLSIELEALLLNEFTLVHSTSTTKLYRFNQ